MYIFNYDILNHRIENQKWIMNGNIYNWKSISFVVVIRKIRKYVLCSSVLFALSMTIHDGFKLIKKMMMPMREGYRKRRENEPKIRRKWQAGWSSVVTWPEVASSPPFNSTFDAETCTRSPLFPSSGFIRLAMGIKFRPL